MMWRVDDALTEARRTPEWLRLHRVLSSNGLAFLNLNKATEMPLYRFTADRFYQRVAIGQGSTPILACLDALLQVRSRPFAVTLATLETSVALQGEPT